MGDTYKEWIDRDAAVVWHGFTQMATFPDNSPLIIEAAEGHELIDVDGRRYLDGISSLWVNTLGHRVPELDQALIDQVGKVAHSTMLGHGNRVVVELCEALSEVVPVESPHFLFASDGAAAVEQALKIAFQYWANQGVEGKTTYLALGNAYHGDTVGAISLGADGFGSSMFDPLRFPVFRAPGYDDPNSLRVAAEMVRQNAEALAAVVIEPLVQGAAGILVADPAASDELAAACEETGVLLICDEVATGFGRTGDLFASTTCGIRPDIMALGKGLTGGYLPMAVTIANEKVFDTFLGEDLGPKTLYHGHSYGGNALSAAVALAHLRLIRSDDIIAAVAESSRLLLRLLHDRIEPLSGVKEVRLRGLMAGIELESKTGARRGRRVCSACVERGVLLRPLGDVVVVMPPLTISAEDLVRIIDALEPSIVEVMSS